MDRWRTYFANNGEPIFDHQLQNQNYRNIPPVDMVRPYKITGNPMNPDIEDALNGIEVDDE